MRNGGGPQSPRRGGGCIHGHVRPALATAGLQEPHVGTFPAHDLDLSLAHLRVQSSMNVHDCRAANSIAGGWGAGSELGSNEQTKPQKPCQVLIPPPTGLRGSASRACWMLSPHKEAWVMNVLQHLSCEVKQTRSERSNLNHAAPILDISFNHCWAVADHFVLQLKRN